MLGMVRTVVQALTVRIAIYPPPPPQQKKNHHHHWYQWKILVMPQQLIPLVHQ